MSDDAHVNELFERLSSDAEFRAAYRRDPAAACRRYGVPGLGDPARAPGEAARVLERRESRSALAGLFVAGLLDVADHVQQVADVPPGTPGAGATEPPSHGVVASAAHTGQLAVVAAASEHAPPADTPYPGDDAPQPEIARWMADRAEQHGLPRELPVMAALVESDLRNVDHGDAASLGYFQMQTTYWLERYPGYPDKPEVQMQWFIDRALAERAKHPELAQDPQRWGEWVANIEQPLASLRGKYAERLDDARALLGDAHGGHASADNDPPDAPATPKPGGEPSAHTAAAGTGPVPVHAASSRGDDVQRVAALPTRSVAAQTGSQPVVDAATHGDAQSGGMVDKLKREAERIDDARVPYLWGGGHAGREAYGSPVTPLDCSGAVSRVLGIDPRVSGGLASWGEPGPGKRVTIFANDEHVLMEIDRHFWGTSAANPGGGAGWIPRSQISDAYLARFTQRHPPGE